MDMYCFPPAGSSSFFYRDWKKYVNNDINICPVELNGRGILFGEKFSKSLDQEVENIYLRIKDNTKKGSFCFFGHSMGAAIALELAYKLQEENNRMPDFMILSGKNPPTLNENSNPQLHKLAVNELIIELKRMGGTPAGVLESPEFSDFFLPVILNDIRINGSHTFKHINKKIGSPIVILNGIKDPYIDFESLVDWSEITSSDTEFYNLDGGHFYLHENETLFFEFLNRIIERRKIQWKRR